MLVAGHMRLVPSSRTDEQLIRAWVKHADVEAFDELYDRHKGPTRGRIASILRPYRLFVDDLVQDTWVAVATTSEWRPRAFRPWVLTIATRNALDRVARYERTPAFHDRARELDRAPREDAGEATDGGAVPLLTRSLVSALALLPSDQREAWTLRYLDREAFDEIARQQDVPVHAAKTRVRLADEELVCALEWGSVGIRIVDRS